VDVCPGALDDDDVLSDAGPVLPSQFWISDRELSGTQQLLLALLLEAFESLRHRRASVRTDAFRWLTGQTWYVPRISIEMVATGLDIEVAVIVRCAEQTWRARRSRPIGSRTGHIHLSGD